MKISVISRGRLATVLLLVVAGVVVDMFSPSDRVLGAVAKLVYLHGALIWVGLMLFALTGILGAAQLILRSVRAESYLLPFEESTVLFWLSATFLGWIVAYLTWGGVIWNEPRIYTSIIISMAVLAAYFVSTEYGNPTRNAIIAVGLALITGGFITGTGRVLHPENPLAKSDPSIQLAFTALVMIFLTAAVQIAKIRMLDRNVRTDTS